MYGDMEPITIHIHHDPVPWTAPKRGNSSYYSTHSKYKEIFHAFILSQFKLEPIKGYVGLEFIFQFPCPKSASKKQKDLMLLGKIKPTKSDCTNCQKFAEDCLNKIVIEDDRNVWQITSTKLYALHGAVIIRIKPCE